jgi:hypothetical protein
VSASCADPGGGTDFNGFDTSKFYWRNS